MLDCSAASAEGSPIAVDSAETTVGYDSTATSPIHAVVEALCAARNERHDELEPLQEFIDTDALAKLIRSNEDARIVFDYKGQTVTVRPDSVTVGPQL